MIDSQSAYREIKRLLAQGGVENAAFEAETLMRAATGHSRFETDEIEPAHWEELRGMAERRAKREPLQYLLGSWPFLGIELCVGPGVLIPRPETEEVCVAAAALLAQRAQQLKWPGRPLRALDLCSGSGALALGLQSFVPEAAILAVELDSQALGFLEKNIEAYRLGQAYEAVPANGCEAPQTPKAVWADALTYYEKLAPGSLDLIVCNPPYVTEAEYQTLAPELYFEPKQALVPPGEGAADGLLFYRAIARSYGRVLAPGGWLVFEIGAGQGPAVRELLDTNGYAETEIKQDMAGHNRIALGQKPQGDDAV